MKLIETMLDTFLANGLMQEEDNELYYYCFDLILSKLVLDGMILCFAVLLGQVPATIAYYLGFSAIRYTGGGYHAKTPG